MEILYTTSDELEGVVFAEKTKAESVARIRQACDSATTWGEFRSQLTAQEWDDIVDRNELDEAQYDPAALFDPEHLAGYADGDYPEWLQATMLSWFPKDLIAKYAGEETDSVLNGEFLILAAERAEEIARDLTARGHVVERSELPFS